jgi:hypothetical protein
MIPSPRAVPALMALSWFACAGTQTIHLTTSEPAEIYLSGKRICARTPCEYRYERQGCGWPRIMATNRIFFEARTSDGRSVVVGATDYCEVDDHWQLNLPPIKQP